jgi:hypothetical protein
MFTIRSTYHAQWEHKLGLKERNMYVASTASNHVWRKLWDPDVPGKVKNIWLACVDESISVKGILANFHIGTQGGCSVCPSGCEDIEHLSFTCDRAKEVWRCLGLAEKVNDLQQTDRSGPLIIEEIITRAGKVSSLGDIGFQELVLTAGWYLWWERRQITNGERVQTPYRLWRLLP